MERKQFATLIVILASTTALLLLFCLLGRTDSEAPGAALAALLDAPTVMGVDPTSTPNDLDTSIVITGTGFTAGLSGTLVITPPLAYLGDTALEEIIWVNTTTLSATVPWGLEPGVYTLTVVNPDGISSTLQNAFTVTEGIGVDDWRTLWRAYQPGSHPSRYTHYGLRHSL
jgi:hypothetical protein